MGLKKIHDSLRSSFLDATLSRNRMSRLGHERREWHSVEIPGSSRPSVGVVKLMLKRVSARQQDQIAIDRKASGFLGSLSTLITLIT